MLKCVSASLLLLSSLFGQATLTTSQIAKRVAPSVVVIHGKTDSGEVLGSGFIISKDGKIVTNFHVIRDLKTATVQLASGEIFDSISVVATDERRDLAIIQIAGFDLPALNMGNSNNLSVGEPVVIVGSPQGLEGTVTAGVLSSIRDSGNGFKVLQTDAAVNPGNSGGPLINSKGQVIGVVSFKLRFSEGLNFAVPSNYVSGLMNAPHEPMTLDRMRSSLSKSGPQVGQRPRPGQQAASEPPLDETLAWLKAHIAQAGYRYSVNVGDVPTQVMSTYTPIGFGSCLVVFAETRTYTGGPSTLTVKDISWAPLGSIADVTLFQDKFNGQENIFGIRLHASSKVILSAKSDTSGSPAKIESTDRAFIEFNDEAAAAAVQQSFLHAVDLCRPNRGSPSLEETLGFLKHYLPLSGLTYLAVNQVKEPLRTQFVENQYLTSPDTECTVVIERIIKGRAADHPEAPGQVGASRYTIPFGSIAEGSIKKVENAPPNWVNVGGDKSSYSVLLTSRARDISLAFFLSTSPTPQSPVSVDSTNQFFLKFPEELEAETVLVQILHAAELCREKE